MGKELTLSIVVPTYEDRNELALALVDLDYYLSRMRYSSLEILLVCGKDDFSGLVEGFGKVGLDVSEVSEDEVADEVRGERVLVFKPEDRSFENFKAIVSSSKKDFGIAVPYEDERSFSVRVLDFLTDLLRRVLRFSEGLVVVRDSGVIYLDSDLVDRLPIFDFSKVVVFGKLMGREVGLVEMTQGEFSPRFIDYVKSWWAMILYKIREWRGK